MYLLLRRLRCHCLPPLRYSIARNSTMHWHNLLLHLCSHLLPLACPHALVSYVSLALLHQFPHLQLYTMPQLQTLQTRCCTLPPRSHIPIHSLHLPHLSPRMVNGDA